MLSAVLKPSGVLTAALLISSPVWSSSVLVVCADEASTNLKDDITELLSGSASKNTVKLAGPKAPATACLSVSAAQRQECFATAGGAANVEALLLVSTISKAGALAVTFEMLAASDGKALRREVLRTTAAKFKAQAGPVLKLVVAPGAAKKKPPEAAVALAVKRPPRVEPAPEPAPSSAVEAPVVVADRPTATQLAPRSVDSTAELVAMPVKPSSSRAGAWVATGAAVAAAVVAGTFGGLGLSNRAQLTRGTNGVSPLSYSQAQALQQTTNVQLTIGLSATIAAGVSGGLAAILWSRN